MEVPDYSEYGFEDFLMDADFRAWVQQPTPETDAFWRRFAAAHPELQATMEDAAWAVEHFTIRPHTLPDASRQRIWATLSRHYDQRYAAAAPADETPVLRLPIWRQSWFRVAASLTGALLVGLGWYTLNVPGRHTIETAYTETKQVTLPDGSTVTLNRNSSLTYADDWSADKPREVWVSGEAFFSVHRHAAPTATAPTRPSDAFIVHTDLTNVEVLGTQFDVNTRRGKTRVVLNEGKVKLTRPGANESLLMQPGDLVDVSPSATGFQKRRVDVDSYDAWRDGQLRFDQTPIRDIISGLEDIYGWHISLRRPNLASQTFTATVPADNPDLLLSLLTESFGLHIHRRGSVVTIE
ncbi:anti-FecI sigma factor, FecR [Fibrella aestuarina BUZ 2]|uniref:Anti-FecI sigma factor, FecR n=1 Tax=Fibrella aestuarina BUZ 2 TaxID=1166018 RepID=I0KDJ2_9BACT|nr:FecR domain-containing protein [Fibrella aestuarina]CCH02195.1 anti-FecI sigma factor, FecR [Fibrella aestuarina BUZ 2]